MFSLRLDTSFPSLQLIILFVNQCNTVDTAFIVKIKVPLPEVWLRMLVAGRGALGSSTGCLAHDSSPWPAMELPVQPAASHMGSTLAYQAPPRWTAQPSSKAWRWRNRTTGALREENQNEEQDLLFLWPWLLQSGSVLQKHSHGMKWVTIPTHSDEPFFWGLLTDCTICPPEG